MNYKFVRKEWFSISTFGQRSIDSGLDVLIGSDYLWEFQKGTTIRGRPEEPVAVHTELGWVLSGPLKRQDVDSRQEVSVNFIGQDSAAFDRASLDSEIH